MHLSFAVLAFLISYEIGNSIARSMAVVKLATLPSDSNYSFARFAKGRIQSVLDLLGLGPVELVVVGGHADAHVLDCQREVAQQNAMYLG